MKKILLLSLIMTFWISLSAQKSFKRASKALGDSPVYFVDSVRITINDFQKLIPSNIGSITIYTDKEASDILGEEGKDGVVYIETKIFCRQRYWKYFKSKSAEYANIAPTAESDSTIQYIINKHVLIPDSPGDLAAINDTIFKSIQIIDKETLLNTYNITDKQYGVIIISDVPKSLYHGKREFKN